MYSNFCEIVVISIPYTDTKGKNPQNINFFILWYKVVLVQRNFRATDPWKTTYLFVMQLPSWTVKKGFFEFNYLDSTLLEINPYFEDISFHKFTVCKLVQHLLLGRVLKILRKSIQLKFLPAALACSKNFEKVHSAEIFLKRLQLSFF